MSDYVSNQCTMTQDNRVWGQRVQIVCGARKLETILTRAFLWNHPKSLGLVLSLKGIQVQNAVKVKYWVSLKTRSQTSFTHSQPSEQCFESSSQTWSMPDIHYRPAGLHQSLHAQEESHLLLILQIVQHSLHTDRLAGIKTCAEKGLRWRVASPAECNMEHLSCAVVLTPPEKLSLQTVWKRAGNLFF